MRIVATHAIGNKKYAKDVCTARGESGGSATLI